MPTTVSNLNRFRPRYAANAASSSSQQYQRAVESTQQSTVIRRRLPRTQQDLYDQRLSQR